MKHLFLLSWIIMTLISCNFENDKPKDQSEGILEIAEIELDSIETGKHEVQVDGGTVYESPSLKIDQLSPNIFVHISYLDIPNYGFFPCNGMIFKNQNEAMVFDTPTTDSVSTELIHWINNELKSEVKSVIATHFHLDCLGGLNAFHDNGIKSYASMLTIKLAKADNANIPQNGFREKLDLDLGGKKIINQFFGEGHTKDNIVVYIPSEATLFGGCLVKQINAGKGNLDDANIDEWPTTIKRIQISYPNLEYIIPGHGKPGGPELLDYTIELFREN